MELDSHKLLVSAGTPADCTTFNEYIEKNCKLYELNNDVKMSNHAAAHYIRGEVSNGEKGDVLFVVLCVDCVVYVAFNVNVFLVFGDIIFYITLFLSCLYTW